MKSYEISVHAAKQVQLKGTLQIPAHATAIVIFAHGSGSSRFSVRNNFVAEIFQKEKIATLLTDLLTEREDRTFENRFDIEMLTDRLIAITKQVAEMPEAENLPIGFFGASTGAAAALKAAAKLAIKAPKIEEAAKAPKGVKARNAKKEVAVLKVSGVKNISTADVQVSEQAVPAPFQLPIKAVVSRGGRPELAKNSLPLVDCPTLLIIGSLDEYVIQINKQAYAQMKCKKKMEIVDGASHLFEEPGKLAEVAKLATEWFKQYLV